MFEKKFEEQQKNNEEQQKNNEELKKKVEELSHLSEINKNITVNDNSTNNTTNNNIYNIFSVGKEDLSRLSKEEIIRICTSGTYYPLVAAEIIHCNEKYPEF
jgi:cell division septum initiation protein DivIVA